MPELAPFALGFATKPQAERAVAGLGPPPYFTAFLAIRDRPLGWPQEGGVNGR